MPRGGLPKPGELKKLQRNPGKRKILKQPDSAQGAGPLPAPGYLSAAERLIWESQVAVLDSLKFIRASDIRAFGRFVKFQTLFEGVAPKVKPTTLVKETVSEHVTMERLDKNFLALLMLDKHLLAYDQHFGTTPAARQALLLRLASRTPQLPFDPQPSPGPHSELPDGTTEPSAPAAKESPIGYGRLN